MPDVKLRNLGLHGSVSASFYEAGLITEQPCSTADPDQVPTPPSVEPSLTVPRAASPGLFGPRTPSNRSWAE